MPLNNNCPSPGAGQTHQLLRLLVVAVSLLAIHVPAQAATLFSLTVSPQASSDGVAHLTWEVPVNKSVRVQQSNKEIFQQPITLYHGNDTGTTITGLKDGTYFFRVGTDLKNNDDINWGEPVQLQVAHHSLTRAFTFFAIGVVVFLATTALIVTGSHKLMESD